jgi:hypothetical protein
MIADEAEASQIRAPAAPAAQQPGELMHLVAAGLTGNGFDVALPGFTDGRRLTLTCPPARCALTVEDCGFTVWDWHPAAGSQADPKQLADLASLLLTGQPGPYPRQGDGYTRPGITLKGIVGRELAARGLQVDLEIYLDEKFFDAHATLVASAPGRDAEVCVTDEGCLSWEREYHAEAEGISKEHYHTTPVTDPQPLAAAIVTAVTQATTAALSGTARPANVPNPLPPAPPPG